MLSKIIFWQSQKKAKKRSSNKFFPQSKTKGVEKNFLGDLQNFNNSKNSAVLEQKTGDF